MVRIEAVQEPLEVVPIPRLDKAAGERLVAQSIHPGDPRPCGIARVSRNVGVAMDGGQAVNQYASGLRAGENPSAWPREPERHPSTSSANATAASGVSALPRSRALVYVASSS
jgi:hypothetical protein